jgi:hypothetical protein
MGLDVGRSVRWGEVALEREALWDWRVRRVILRYAQNDKGTGEAKVVLTMRFLEGGSLAMVRSLQYN